MVHDLYILMITAGVVSLLFKLLKQSEAQTLSAENKTGLPFTRQPMT